MKEDFISKIGWKTMEKGIFPMEIYILVNFPMTCLMEKDFFSILQKSRENGFVGISRIIS